MKQDRGEFWHQGSGVEFLCVIAYSGTTTAWIISTKSGHGKCHFSSNDLPEEGVNVLIKSDCLTATKLITHRGEIGREERD